MELVFFYSNKLTSCIFNSNLDYNILWFLVAMKNRKYQVCTKCVMDTSDELISFNKNGVCNYCIHFENVTKRNWHHGDEIGLSYLDKIVAEIKEKGKHEEYDSILGMSGGIDSSYMAYIAKKNGLRPLILHVDCGWNSEQAVSNIETICKKLNFDLYTHVVSWDEMRDIQLSFLRAGVPNQDIPQDHAIFAALYKFAEDHKIHYVLNGGNIATESILPTSWGANSKDLYHLKSIHKIFGTIPLKTFPKMSSFKYYIYYPYIWKMNVVRLLNYVNYDKEKAIETLESELDWRYYGGKHYESTFTKFFQAYYLPTRFGFDKRRAHLSSLVVSGQIDRGKAERELTKDIYPKNEFIIDKELIMKKLKLSVKQFDELLNLPLKYHSEYPNSDSFYKLKENIGYFLRKIKVL